MTEFSTEGGYRRRPQLYQASASFTWCDWPMHPVEPITRTWTSRHVTATVTYYVLDTGSREQITSLVCMEK